jgi:hypothetical protein
MKFTSKSNEIVSAVSALRRAIAEVKQRWSIIRWVTKNDDDLELLRVSEGRLVPAVFAVVRINLPAPGPRGGLWLVLLMCNPMSQQWGHK